MQSNKTSGEDSFIQDITYMLINAQAPPVVRTIKVDLMELRKNVLYYLHFSLVMKITKVKMADILNIIATWCYYQCGAAENIVSRNHMQVPSYEIMRLLSQMYASKLIDTIDDNGEIFVKLTESGKKICEEWLTQGK